MAHLGDEISHGELEESKCYCFSYLQIRVENYSYPPLVPSLGLDPHPGDKYNCCLIPGATAGATCWRIKIRQYIGCLDGVTINLAIPGLRTGMTEKTDVLKSYALCPKSYLKYETTRRAIPFVLEPPQMDPDLVLYKEKTYTQLDLCGECKDPPVQQPSWAPPPPRRDCGGRFPVDLFDPLLDVHPAIVPGWDYNSDNPTGVPGHGFGPECVPPTIPSQPNPWTHIARFTPPGRPGSARMVSTSPDPIYFNTTPDLQQEEDEIKRMLAWAEHEHFLTKPKEICDVIRNRGRAGKPPVFGICNIHRQRYTTDRKRPFQGLDG